MNCVSDHTESLKVGDFLGDRTVLSAAQNSRKGGIASRGYRQCALTLFTLARGFSTRTEFQVGLLRPRNNFRTCEKLQRSGHTAGCHLLPPQGSGRAIREAIVVVPRHSGNKRTGHRSRQTSLRRHAPHEWANVCARGQFVSGDKIYRVRGYFRRAPKSWNDLRFRSTRPVFPPAVCHTGMTIAAIVESI